MAKQKSRTTRWQEAVAAAQEAADPIEAAADVLARISTEYPDVDVHREGTLFLVGALTDSGVSWLSENVDVENATFWLSNIVVEHRYIEQLVIGMIEAGLVVKYDGQVIERGSNAGS